MNLIGKERLLPIGYSTSQVKYRLRIFQDYNWYKREIIIMESLYEVIEYLWKFGTIREESRDFPELLFYLKVTWNNMVYRPRNQWLETKIHLESVKI